MSRLRRCARAALGLAAALIGSHAAAACKINSYAELPVTVRDGRILVDATINGQRVKMFADTGAFATTMFGDGAKKLGLGYASYVAPAITGIGGDTGAVERDLRDFKLGKYDIADKRVAVAMDTHDEGGAVGLIGEDLFGNFDVEFDLADGVVRLLKPEGCTDEDMPYWATSYSETPLDDGGQNDFMLHVHIALNGRPVEAIVDSGATTTIVSPVAAMDAGVGHTQMRAAGYASGLGHDRMTAFSATFATVSVGGETAHNVDLTVADMFKYSQKTEIGSLIPHENIDLPSVLLGADFLKSHRVLFSRSHRMMFFTYAGGAVFGAPAWQAATVQP